MLEMGMDPIWVFDGEPTDSKSLTKDLRIARSKHFQQEMQKAMMAGSMQDVIKYSKRSFRISAQDIEYCQQLLEYLGANVVYAKEEADVAIGYLARAKNIQYCFSEDSDLLVHGVDFLLRSDRNGSKYSGKFLTQLGKKTYQLVDRKLVLEALELTHAQLIDLAILVGNDYVQSVNKLGVTTAHKMIKKFGNMEEILKSWNSSNPATSLTRYDPGKYELDIIQANYQKIRDLYLCPSEIEFESFERNLHQLQKEKLLELLDRFDFTKTRIDNIQKRIDALLDPKQKTE
jgi:flap endonuclease-1